MTLPDQESQALVDQQVRHLVQLSAAAVGRLELQSVLLGRSTAEILTVGVEPPFEVTTSASGQWGVSGDGTAFQARVDVALQAKATSDADAVVWRIEASHWLLYSIAPGVPLERDQLDAYAATGAVFSAWPYVRELVQSLTHRMGVPPLTLPLLKTPLDVALFAGAGDSR